MKKVMLIAAAGAAGLMTLPALGEGELLYDNGPVDGTNGYSNGTINAFGARRTLLDDFTVPAGETWEINGISWRSVWGTPGGGAFGIGVDLSFRSDAGGTPGGFLGGGINQTAYSEVDTGNIFFDREEHAHAAKFDVVTLTSGTYWFEATVIGPENNFWLTAAQQGNECWVNYSDFNGLESGTNQFGVASDINFALQGVPTPGVLALLGVAGLAGTRRRRR